MITRLFFLRIVRESNPSRAIFFCNTYIISWFSSWNNQFTFFFLQHHPTSGSFCESNQFFSFLQLNEFSLKTTNFFLFFLQHHPISLFRERNHFFSFFISLTPNQRNFPWKELSFSFLFFSFLSFFLQDPISRSVREFGY